MLHARYDAYLLACRIRSPYFQNRNGLSKSRIGSERGVREEWRGNTYAGHPMMMATTARIVSPFPNPRAWYIAGANSGKPKPHSERKKDTAARADNTMLMREA